MFNYKFIKKSLAALWLTVSLFLGSFNVVTSSTCTGEENTPQKTTSENSAQALHGEVEVSFKIGLDGKANILDIQSENPYLVNYVRTKLNKIQLQKDDINLDEIITYRFIFKKDA